MVDVAFRVVAQRRDGLLLALGQVVLAHGYALLRQRIAHEAEGVVLTMVVRGPEPRLLELEEHLGTHALVGSFEATSDLSRPAPLIPRSAMAPPAPPAAATAGPIDYARADRVLPQLARAYPKPFIFVVALTHELAPEQRETTLAYIGKRVGTWVYKRDFALGAQLAPTQAIRQVVLPAMRQLVTTRLDGDAIQVTDSPFPHRGHAGPCCHFLRGMLEGLLGASSGGRPMRARETRCRNTGASTCRFEFD